VKALDLGQGLALYDAQRVTGDAANSLVPLTTAHGSHLCRTFRGTELRPRPPFALLYFAEAPDAPAITFGVLALTLVPERALSANVLE
jgi:hypothetical protein